MKLWTIRSLKSWEYAKRANFVWNDAEYAPVDFRNSYHWMARQMYDRLGAPSNPRIVFPVWAWLERPDIRTERHHYYGSHVLIEFESDKALLSDFDNWHFVLNRGFLGTQKDTNEIDREWHKLKHRIFEQLPRYIKEPIEESWNKIFTIKNKSVVQATLWGIPIENVKKVTQFKGLLPKEKAL